jgi:hypothetical protein
MVPVSLPGLQMTAKQRSLGSQRGDYCRDGLIDDEFGMLKIGGFWNIRNAQGARLNPT